MSHIWIKSGKCDRFTIYFDMKGEIGFNLLPPNKISFLQHTLPVSYVWQKCLTLWMHIPPPTDHRWYLKEEDDLNINWSDEEPAPSTVPELISYSCKKDFRYFLRSHQLSFVIG